MLGGRLRVVVNMVPPGHLAVDIGSDHALVPIHLVRSGRVERVIAVEKTPGPWLRSLRAVKDAHLEEKIEVRLGNGFKALSTDESVTTVIMAGMGGETIASICRCQAEKLCRVKNVVIQPMGREGEARKVLGELGFRVNREDMVWEGHRLYQVIAMVPGMAEYLEDPLLLELGPLLVTGKHPLLPLHLQKALSRRRIRAAGFKKSSHDQKKLLLLAKEISRLEAMLNDIKTAKGNQLDG